MEQKQVQRQAQRQVQKMSQRQIQAVSFLGMGSKELSAEIYRFASENPALEIVKDRSVSFSAVEKSNDFAKILEAREDYGETLQQHLMSQINMMNLSKDEASVCQALIYNLDKNGCYGSMLAPESLLDKSRPQQNQQLLEKCMDIVQRLDPIGTCCKSPEESLFVQAKIKGDASPLTLFILDGHLELLNPPQAEKVVQNLKDFQKKWHSKKFAPQILLDKIDYDEFDTQDSIDYILKLNPRPAQNYISDVSDAQFNRPDVILTVTKEDGYLSADDYSKGQILGGKGYYFQIKYASGILPEVRISPEYMYDKAAVEKAKEFIANLQYRESSIVLQGCAIVKFQKDFFEKGPGHLNVLTRRQVASMLGIHESTVSRMSSKKNSKYIQTDWGLFPASFFFSSGVKSTDGKEKISAAVIKEKIQEYLSTMQEAGPDGKSEKISDSKLAEYLNQQGIKIARRTVAKYRSQIGINNSYRR